MGGRPLSNNTTGQTGWLGPLNDDASYDLSLETQLSIWIRNVSGLAAGRVIARWQSDQPPIPPVTVNWCAFGVLMFDADSYPAFVNQGDATAEQWRHELVECLASFYGPDGQRTAARFRDGIAVSQNNDMLKQMGLTLVDCDHIRPAPELLNNQWVRRYDLMVRLRRKTVSTWGIQSLTDAPVKFFGE